MSVVVVRSIMWLVRECFKAYYIFHGTIKMLDLYLWLYKRSSQNKIEKEKERWQKKN